MDWGSYLAYGTTSMGIIPASYVSDPKNSHAILHILKTYHHFILEVDEADRSILEEWEGVVQQAFDLPEDVKIAGGAYRSEHGLAVGYKRDYVRQFFETRITRAGIPSPTYDIHIHTYTYTIRRLIHLLSCLAVKILHRLEEAMGLKRGVLVNLTDLHTHTQPCTRTPSPLSSYVLRICCYHTKPTKDGGGHTHTHTHGDVEGMVYTQDVCDGCKHDDHDGDGDGREMGGFGAHTDTSFLTLSPHSSLPGLDIYHPLKRVWQSVETHTYTHTPAHTDNQTQTQTHTDTNTRNMKHCVVVFTGELLQILTKHKLQACIHRVRIHPPHTHTHNYGDIRRISCPFIIRSYDTARLDLDMSGDDEYVYGDGDGNDVYSVGHGSEHSNEVVDDHSTSSGSHTHSTGAGWISRGLQDIDMFTIHKLLDLKRQKCFKQHEEDMGEWVLSAFGAKTS